MSQRSAIVIGAGFGGLALAIRLQSAGIRTLLVEKRDKPGGRAYVFEQDGFTFDAGPTVITDPACLEELPALSGRRLADYVDLLPVAPFYRLFWPDGRSFDYVNDQSGLDEQIARFDPADRAGYRKFLAYSEAVFEQGYRKLGHVAFPSFASMLRVAPQLIALESYRSVHAIVARYIKDPQLRQAFSFHTLLVGGSPFAASSIYALIHALERQGGVWFPRGGTGALVRALVRLFQDLGGTLRLGTDIARITSEAGRITGIVTRDGQTLQADLVASNADVVHTYTQLLADTPAVRATGRALARARHSPSLFLVYFGLKREHPQLAQHSILFGPRYKEHIAEIYAGWHLPDDFSLYLHAPSVTDPSLAPPGCSAYYALSVVPNLRHDAIDWAGAADGYRDRILATLEARLIPGLRDDLVALRTWTPADFRDTLNAHQGAAFSLEPILTQSAWFRAHNRDRRLRGLYLVGAGTHPGAGVPGVVGSAKATARLILADLGLPASDPSPA